MKRKKNGGDGRLNNKVDMVNGPLILLTAKKIRGLISGFTEQCFSDYLVFFCLQTYPKIKKRPSG